MRKANQGGTCAPDPPGCPHRIRSSARLAAAALTSPLCSGGAASWGRNSVMPDMSGRLQRRRLEALWRLAPASTWQPPLVPDRVRGSGSGPVVEDRPFLGTFFGP